MTFYSLSCDFDAFALFFAAGLKPVYDRRNENVMGATAMNDCDIALALPGAEEHLR